MMDFAHSTDVYQIYADMVSYDARRVPESGEHAHCVYTSRKDGHTYARSYEEIMAKYGDRMMIQEEMPPMNWPQMRRYMYTARLETFEEAQAFITFVQGS